MGNSVNLIIKEILDGLDGDIAFSYTLAHNFLVEEFALKDLPSQILRGLSPSWTVTFIKDLMGQYGYELKEIPIGYMLKVAKDNECSYVIGEHLIEQGYGVDEIPLCIINSILKVSINSYEIVTKMLESLKYKLKDIPKDFMDAIIKDEESSLCFVIYLLEKGYKYEDIPEEVIKSAVKKSCKIWYFAAWLTIRGYKKLGMLEKLLYRISRKSKWSYYYAIEVLDNKVDIYTIDFKIWYSIQKSGFYRNKFIEYARNKKICIRGVGF